MSRSLHARVLAAAVVVALSTLCAGASAQMIIKNPGDHLNSVELEPHLVLRPLDTPHNDLGLGVGFRATIPIVKNGFVSTINNSVGIGFGLDYMRYDACGKYYGVYYDCGKLSHFSIPVVMQWNFFLTPSWSVFGEPGLAYNIYSYDKDACGVRVVGRNGAFVREDVCPDHAAIDLTLFAGARWHFANTTTLTMRIGWPYWSVGVSFLLAASRPPAPRLPWRARRATRGSHARSVCQVRLARVGRGVRVRRGALRRGVRARTGDARHEVRPHRARRRGWRRRSCGSERWARGPRGSRVRRRWRCRGDRGGGWTRGSRVRGRRRCGGRSDRGGGWTRRRFPRWREWRDCWLGRRLGRCGICRGGLRRLRGGHGGQRGRSGRRRVARARWVGRHGRGVERGRRRCVRELGIPGGVAGIGGIAGTGGTAGSSAGASGTGGTGGTVVAFPAPHPPAPAFINVGGAVLGSPKVVPVFFTPEESESSVAAITEVLEAYVTSATFGAVTAEYGVGAATVTPPVKYPHMPMATEDVASVGAWLQGKLNGNDALLPTAEPGSLYVLYYPASTSLSVGGLDACLANGATHGSVALDVAHGNANVAFAIVPRCASFAGLTGLDAISVESTGAVSDAVVNPYPEPAPAYYSFDNEHFYWSAVAAGEIAGACLTLAKPAFSTVPELAHPVARTWSNVAAGASHDPCTPGSSPYFAAAPVLDLQSFAGGTLMAWVVKIPVGQQKAVEVDFFSDGDTTGPWTVKAVDTQTLVGNPAELAFALDSSSGANGTKSQLTITALSKGSGVHYFLLLSQKGATDGGRWIGAVVN